MRLFIPTEDEIVATFDKQLSMAKRGYEAEREEYENSRNFRELASLMRERSAVKCS